ncbi:MAG: hypothetical protein LBD17_00845, partial [Endomicrobium sp.]|nr:hypothetical protein [Endomicrobium sp.]
IPIAWLWARTVKCPNPACSYQVPLIHSFDICTKKGHEKHLKPKTSNGYYSFSICKGLSPSKQGTISRAGAICLHCKQPIKFDYIRKEGQESRIGSQLLAIVVDSENGKIYLEPNEINELPIKITRPNFDHDIQMADNPSLNTRLYGLTRFSDLFNDRQLNTLHTFSSLIKSAKNKIYKDALRIGMVDDPKKLNEGGTGAKAYSEAITVYLSLLLDNVSDYNSSMCSWEASRQTIRDVFARQAISMVWDYAETNPFSGKTGSIQNMIEWISKCLQKLPRDTVSTVFQQDTKEYNHKFKNLLISTDPPYYDNIDYADISDFFYFWQRNLLKDIYPDIFATLATPKNDEIVANEIRHNKNKEKARIFFEKSILKVFQNIFIYARDDFPVTIYYAYKETYKSDKKESYFSNNTSGKNIISSGWETMLNGLIKSGFTITGTWPLRTERKSRTMAIKQNALSTSIVLCCRKRPLNADWISTQEFSKLLRKELKFSIHELQKSNISPVDLAQAVIGPGMAVYSKYSKVMDPDGTILEVRNALEMINQFLDSYLTEQEGELDPESRFCLSLFTEYQYNKIEYGTAEQLSKAKNASLKKLSDLGVLKSSKGVVQLFDKTKIENKIDGSCIWLLTLQLIRTLENQGEEGCAKIFNEVGDYKIEQCRSLAYLLYTICDRKKYSNDAKEFDDLVTSWPKIQNLAVNQKSTYKSASPLQFD